MKKFGCVAKRKQFNDFWNFCILFESTANWQIQLVIICTNENNPEYKKRHQSSSKSELKISLQKIAKVSLKISSQKISSQFTAHKITYSPGRAPKNKKEGCQSPHTLESRPPAL